jgi:hypothetical protein
MTKRGWAPGRPLEPAVRFWAKVKKDGSVPPGRPDLGPCWVWTAYTSPLGYGRFSAEVAGRRTQVFAHRWAYEQQVGAIPAGLDLDHLCRVRHCVNPAHLEAVTARENVLRGGMPNGALSRRTHCGRGHPFDAANTYYRPDGGRRCRKCAALQVARSARRYQAERSGQGLEIDQEEAGWDMAKLRHELRLLRAENARLKAALLPH